MVFINAEVFTENCIYTIKRQKKEKSQYYGYELKI